MGWLLLVVWGLLPVLLTFGAIDALVPLLIIIILIAAAATLNRGWNALNIFGIGTLAGVAATAGTKGSFRGKSPLTGGKKFGRGYEKIIKGATTAAKGAAGKVAMHNMTANRSNQAAAKAALVNSVLSKTPPPPARPGMATMALSLVAGGNIRKYHNTVNKLSDTKLAPADRAALNRKKENLERSIYGDRAAFNKTKAAMASAIYGKTIAPEADRPYTSVEEISTVGVQPIIDAASETAEKLKKQGFDLGPTYLEHLIERESVEGGAEAAARQNAFRDALATTPATYADVEKLVDRHLYSSTLSPEAIKEKDRIETEVAAAYYKLTPVTGWEKLTAELGFPAEKTSGKQAVAFTGYAVGSTLSVGALPGANIAFRQYRRWKYGQ